MKFTVIIHKSKYGYVARVPTLLGCHTQGDNFEKAKANIAEAIELYLEDADEELYHETPEEARKKFMASVSVRINS